jgi:hypothetical protein
MLKLLHELIKGNELKLSLTGVSAKGGLAVVLAFLLAAMVLIYLTVRT